MIARGLEAGFLLDSLWHTLRGDGMSESKRPALMLLGGVLDRAGTDYEIIGGVALQIYQAEPRTTLDIDVAVAGLDRLPRAELESAGFRRAGVFSHFENWLSPDGVPVQFTDDPALTESLGRVAKIELEGVALRVIDRADLLHEKLRSGSDPARRRSKRLQDLVDAQRLLEEFPELDPVLTDGEREMLESLPD
jgi:hypothetical protein